VVSPTRGGTARSRVGGANDEEPVMTMELAGTLLAGIPVAQRRLKPAGISTPVGRHDLATRLRVAEAASARHDWPLHVIEDCADDPPLEQPEAFVAALRTAIGTL
jgi:pimeloyl-ACP methyl ester carboxylesterase